MKKLIALTIYILLQLSSLYAVVSPTTQASNIVVSNLTSSSLTIAWSAGNGSSYAVFMLKGNSGNPIVANNTTYTANPVFGSGSVAGAGWYCVYNGASTTANITGLAAVTTYRIAVLTYNGTSGTEMYKIGAGTNNPVNTTTPKAIQVITFDSIPQQLFSNVNINAVASASSGLPVSYSSQNTAVATITAAGVIHFNSIGTTTITVSQAGNGTYLKAPDVIRYLIVVRGPQTITFPPLPSKVYKDPAFLPGATVSSGLTITYTSDNPAIASIVGGNKIQINGVGTVNITASQAGTSNYFPATSITRQLIIDKASQTINYNPVPPTPITKNYGNGDFKPATATSGLTVTYQIADTMIANINKSTGAIHIKTVGTTTITASQSGSTLYYPATDVIQTLIISKGTQTITFVSGSQNKTFGNGDYSPANASSNLPVTYTTDNPAVATVVNGKIHIVGAGQVTITAKQGGNINYLPAPDAQQLLTVAKADQIISFYPLGSYLVGSPDFDPGAKSSAYLPITYISEDTNIATIINGKIHVVAIGTVKIDATQPGNANYKPANTVIQILTVPAGQSIIFAPIPFKHYTDADFDPGAHATSGLQVIYTSDNSSVAVIIGNKIHIKGVGTSNITAYQQGDTSYNAADPMHQILTVDRGPQIITFPLLNAVMFKDTFIIPGATSNSGLNVSYTTSNPDVAVIAGNMIYIVGAGTTMIKASQMGSSLFDSATSVIRTLVVNKANQVITFAPPTSMVYSDIYIDPATSSSRLPIVYSSSNLSVAEIKNGKIHILGSGTTDITANQPGDANYLPASFVKQSLMVTKAVQTITFNPIPNKTFGGNDFRVVASSSSGLGITFSSNNTAIATISGDTVHIVGAGYVSITAHQAGNEKFGVAADVSQSFTVSRKNQSISFQSFAPVVLGGTAVTPTASSSSGLPITFTSNNVAVAKIVAGQVQIVGLGIAIITASQSGDANYNAAVDVTQTFTVNKNSQVITNFNPFTPCKVGDPDINLAAVSSSGLPVNYISDNTYVATVTGNVVHILNAGTANIIARQPGDASYFAAVNVSQILLVNNTSQSIDTFTTIPVKTYGDPDFNLHAVASSGLPVTFSHVNTAVTTIINGRVHIENAGSDTLIADQSGNGSYTAAVSRKQVLLVNKAPQIITFNSIPVKKYGSADFFLSATGGNSGNPVTFSVADTTIAIATGNKIKIKGTGTTTIIASQAGNSNYRDTVSLPRTLTVVKDTNIITFLPIVTKSYLDADFDPGAASSSGLPITYTSSNLNVDSIIFNKIHIVGAGTSLITASQAGDANHVAAAPVSQMHLVLKLTQTITFNSLPPVTIGDADFYPPASSSSNLQVTFISDNVNVATIVNGKIHIVGGGSCTITALQSGNANYEAATAQQQALFVKTKDQVISFKPIPVKTFRAIDFVPPAKSSSGLPLTYTTDNSNVAVVVAEADSIYIHITGVGQTKITAKQAGDPSYKPAKDSSQMLTVILENQLIDSIKPFTKKRFGDPDFEPIVYSTWGVLPLTLRSSDTTVAVIFNGKIRIVGRGSTRIYVSQAGNTNYNPTPSPDKYNTLTVSYETQTILNFSNNDSTIFYGTEDFDPGAISSNGLKISYTSSNPSIATVSPDKHMIHIVKAGSVVITASQTGDNNNYAAPNLQKRFIIKKAPLTVTADDVTRSYGVPDEPFTVWYDGFVNGDDFTNFGTPPVVNTVATINSPVGVYDLIPQGGKSDNYAFIYKKGILTIEVAIPERPARPEGQTLLCINPDNQVYQSNTASQDTLSWSVTPSEAATIIGKNKIANIRFNTEFSGRAGLSVIAKNASGSSAPSDTLFVDILPHPNIPGIIYDSSYCLNNKNADSIVMIQSQKMYVYQLTRNGSIFDEPREGTDTRLGWYNINYGKYAILEQICKTTVASNIVITETNDVAAKPKLQVKWNDVIICNNASDSLIHYQWYYNEQPVPDGNLQYLWTQKKQGSYTVEITDKNGCQAISDAVLINAASGTIYPNPSAGQFKVTFSSTDRGQITLNIYRLNSLLLKNMTFSKETDLFEQDITLQNIEPGTYFIEITSNGQRILFQKLIINY